MSMSGNTINWLDIRNTLEAIAKETQREIKTTTAREGDKVINTGRSGDITSLADEAGEAIVSRLVQEKLSAHRCALIDESTAQLVKLYPGDDDPELVIIADALDGTRLNMLKYDSYATCIVAFAYQPKAKLKDLQISVISTATGETFSAVKGEGVRLNGGSFARPDKIDNQDTATTNLGWYFDFAAAEPILAAQYIAPLMANYLNPGFVIMNAVGYAATRLLLPTSKMTAAVLPGPRIRQQWPELESIFQHVSGSLTGAHIWDLAPIYLLLQEADMYIASTTGRGLADAPLIVKPPLAGYDIVAAVNETLGQHIVTCLDQQEQLLRQNRQQVIANIQRLYHLT